MAVVIIPAFQPDQTVIGLVDQLWTLGYRVIIVDDGSDAEHQKVLEQVSDVAILLHHPVNRGKGAAIKTALSYIQKEMWDCDVVGIMDCDGQHLVKDMKKVLECVEHHREALVLGVRTLEKMPWKSRIGNRITREIFHLLSGVKVSDTQTGLRAFSSDLINTMRMVEGERYEYETNVLLATAEAKIPIEETPIETVYHDRSNSCSHFHILRDSLRIYRDIVKYAWL